MSPRSSSSRLQGASEKSPYEFITALHVGCIARFSVHKHRVSPNNDNPSATVIHISFKTRHMVS